VIDDIGVYMVEWFGFSEEYVWKHGSGHEKIAVDVYREYLCFGDANHRVSEITHAGTVVRNLSLLNRGFLTPVKICLKNPTLAETFMNAVLSVFGDYNVVVGSNNAIAADKVFQGSVMETQASSDTKILAVHHQEKKRKQNYSDKTPAERKREKLKREEAREEEELNPYKAAQAVGTPYQNGKKSNSKLPDELYS